MTYSKKIKYSLLFLFIIILHSACGNKEINNLLILWYDSPASIWEEALPLGNGKTGAMVFGGIHNERYQLNDNTLWSGKPLPGNQPQGPEILKTIRELLSKGDYGKADIEWRKMHGPYSARYLPLADLHVEFQHAGLSPTAYYRDLDLDKAITTVKYTIDEIDFHREAFISYPDQAMVVRYEANKKSAINLTAALSSKLKYNVETKENGYLILMGKAPKYVAHRNDEPHQVLYSETKEGEGTNFEVRISVKNQGGTIEIEDNKIVVKNANAATFYLVSATSFNGFDKSPGLEGKDPSIEADRNLHGALSKSYKQLKNTHIQDYQQLFRRVNFSLGTSEDTLSLPTDDRMLRFNQGHQDHHLIELYFQFGRYLMIAGSRTGSQALNLQGLWNDHVQPPWGSNYTMNINTEMNYWPAEVTNLSECHSPLFDFMKNLAVNGAITAKTNYGIENGWCAHHNSDIWAKTSPTGGEDWDPRGAPRWSCWPMAGGWLARHPWEHFLYTGDTTFLRNTGWPLMKGVSEFMLEWLIEDENGYLITSPSTSPENVFRINNNSYEISKASTMDMSIIRDLFFNSMEAMNVLNVDAEFNKKLREAFPRLYPFQIGQYGQLQEWYKDYDDPKDTHRHLSHLYGLHPANLIIPRLTPELAMASKQSLNHRGDISTGWSMAWKVNWWARLGDGDRALKILRSGLNYIGPKKESRGSGGTYPNLFDAHPPFQIDGNYGGTAGIADMLLQTHAGEIELLPALPKDWQDGKITGLKSRGGYEVEMTWRDEKITEAKILSTLGGNCRVRSSIPLKVVETDFKPAEGENPNRFFNIQEPPIFERAALVEGTILPDNYIQDGYVIDFMTEKGRWYTLVLE